MAAEDGADAAEWRDSRSAQSPADDHRLVGGWAVPSSGAASLDHDFGPDASPTRVDMASSFKGVNGKPLKWEQIHTTNGGPEAPQWVDFKQFCADRHFRTDDVVGYFATTIVTSHDTPAELLIGSDDAAKSGSTAKSS